MSSDKKRVTGRQIAAARDLLNISQGDFAVAVGMLRPALARIEAGRVKPRIATMAKIVTELERRGIEFLNGRGVILKRPDDSEAEHEGAAD